MAFTPIPMVEFKDPVAVLDGNTTSLIAGYTMEFKTEVEIRPFLPKFMGMKIRRKDVLPTEVGIKKLLKCKKTPRRLG